MAFKASMNCRPHLSTITGSSSLITMALFSQYNKTTIPKHPNALWSERNAYKMKWLYILILLFIAMWVLANSHFHNKPFMVYDHEKPPCGGNSLECGQGVMEGFETRQEVNMRRANRRILNDYGSNEEKVASSISEESNRGDYGESDPPPAATMPTKKTVQYRIFSRPPAASPPPKHL